MQKRASDGLSCSQLAQIMTAGRLYPIPARVRERPSTIRGAPAPARPAQPHRARSGPRSRIRTASWALRPGRSPSRRSISITPGSGGVRSEQAAPRAALRPRRASVQTDDDAIEPRESSVQVVSIPRARRSTHPTGQASAPTLGAPTRGTRPARDPAWFTAARARVSYALRTQGSELCLDETAPILGIVVWRAWKDFSSAQREATERLYGTSKEVLVTYVHPGSPADEAGIRSGDRILARDGRKVRKMTEVFRNSAHGRVGKAARSLRAPPRQKAEESRRFRAARLIERRSRSRPRSWRVLRRGLPGESVPLLESSGGAGPSLLERADGAPCRLLQ